MLLIPPTEFRRRRGRTRRTPPTPLTLVRAVPLSATPPVLRLGFDRAIDVSAMDPSQVTVQLPSVTGLAYAGTAVVGTPDARTVDVAGTAVGPAQGTDNTVTATAATGIVAVDDGGTWAGVSNLELPFP